MTKQEFAACEREHFVQWQVQETQTALDSIEALRGQAGKEGELAQAERRLAAARSKVPLDFWWEDSGADVANAAAGDRATTERRLREEKELETRIAALANGPERWLASARSAATTCMYQVRLEFLQTGKVRPAKVRRALTRTEVSSACGSQLARAQEVNARRLPAEVEKLRKRGADPKRFPLYALERQLAGAKSKSAIDHFWEDTVGYDYIAKIAGGDMSDADQRIRTSKRFLAAIEARDRNTYVGIAASEPPKDWDLEQTIAREEAQTCALELRQHFQRTGKLSTK